MSTDETIRKLRLLGSGPGGANQSLGLTLPAEMIRDLGWQQGDFLGIRQAGSRIVIRNLTGQEDVDGKEAEE